MLKSPELPITQPELHDGFMCKRMSKAVLAKIRDAISFGLIIAMVNPQYLPGGRVCTLAVPLKLDKEADNYWRFTFKPLILNASLVYSASHSVLNAIVVELPDGRKFQIEKEPSPRHFSIKPSAARMAVPTIAERTIRTVVVKDADSPCVDGLYALLRQEGILKPIEQQKAA